MAARKISNSDWEEARKRYEREPATGYKQIAQALDCSKALVARHAQKNKWQKSLSAISPVSNDRVDAPIDNLQKPANRPEQGTGVHAKAPEKEPPAPLLNNGSADIPVMPAGLSAAERQAFIEAAVLARQTQLNQTQAREIKAIKNGVYGAVKDGSYDSARSAKARMEALKGTHAMEMTNELERVRLELGAFSGVRQQACQIIVHQMPGCQIAGGDNSPEAMERRAVVADARMTVMEARRIVAEADAEIARKAGWDVIDVGGNNVEG